MPSTIIDRLVDGVYPAMALVAAMQLDLFSTLAAGPRDAVAISAERELDAARTRILLDALTATGLLSRDGGRYALTEESRTYLTNDSPWSRVAGGRVLDELWRASLGSAETVRSGRPASALDYGEMTGAEAEELFEGLRADAAATAARMLEHLWRPEPRAVLDLGGGAGGAASTFADHGPRAKVDVLELPNLVAVAEQLLSRRGEHRVDVVGADATVEVPGSYDLIWALFVTQTMGPTEAEALICNASRALSPGGRLALVNVVVDPTRIGPPRAALFSLALMNLYDGGQAYSTADYERWLRSAGLPDVEWHAVNDTVRMVVGRHPEARGDRETRPALPGTGPE